MTQLCVNKLSVASSSRQELIVSSRFDDSPLFEHDDLIRFSYCRETVGDHQCSAAGHELSERAFHRVFTFLNVPPSGPLKGTPTPF